MKYLTAKRLGNIAAGAVLFFLLGAFVSIPSPIDTVNICLQYGLQAFLAMVCGPLTAAASGLLGHIAIDLYFGELCWSWIIATWSFGGLLGILANVTGLRFATYDRENLVRFNLCQLAIHVVCWAGVAPVLEILLYSESMDRIFEQGLTAALSNAVTTAIISSILLCAYAAHHTKKS
jgi:energy-coupling factor transport system substrate-specific component